MSESESKTNTEAVVYFVISPLEGPAYQICGDDDLQAVGGVHAFERHLETQSYWFARMGQISLKQNPDGATFQDIDLAKLPEPLEGAWQTGQTTGLCALKKVHDLVEVTAVKFWYDSLWLSKPVPIGDLVLAEYSFRVPLQLRWTTDHRVRWTTDHRLISVQILRIASC